MKLVSAFLLLLLMPFFAACGGGNAVKVYKSDGSVQCGGAGTPLSVMEAELTGAGIPVYCSQQGSDGYAYIAACGAGTGRINIYLIDKAHLAQAESLGFANVATLPDYIDQPCF